MAKNIVTLNVNSTDYTARPYGTCSTAAGTAAKAVTCADFELVSGTTIIVKFDSANTASTPTLNVNSKGAKNVFHKGAQITSGGNKALLAGTVEFLYDGTLWQLLGNYIDTDSNTKYSAGNGLTLSSTTFNVGAGTGISVGTDTVGISDTYNTYITNGNTAYGWGNHASAGYIKSYVDTKNTAGSTNDTNKLFLIGAKSLSASIQTYSNSGVYATNGNMYATNFYTTSDKCFKTNIKDIKDSENCPVVKQFEWKENGTKSYGFIAQELEEQGYTELVDTDEDGLKKVNYNATLSLVVGKMLAKIEELENKILELESKIN